MKNGATKTTLGMGGIILAAVTPLRIAYVASEVNPFAKTGGLADVAGALPATLGALGHDVRVFMPLYGSVDRKRFSIVERHADIPIRMGGRTIPFALSQSTLPGSEVPIYFIDCSHYYGREGIYTNDPDEPFRFLYFCRAVFESCQRLGFSPDIFHANDWQTALVPLLKKTLYAWDQLFSRAKTLLTIHNIGYQGTFGREFFDTIGIDDLAFVDADDLSAGLFNILKTGILHADVLTTVSPTYAEEIQTEEQGYGLEAILRGRRADLVGILNGVDYNEWNPSRDRYIPFRYSDKSLWRKKRNKVALLEQLSLPVEESVPLLGMVTRLSYQKGIELLYDSLPEILSSEALTMVALGSGERVYERFFMELQQRFPSRVVFYRGFHEELAHLIEAGADMFLMPSRYEPCGMNQMYSLKYGTVPIVRKTGGLADSVRLFDPATGEGTGVVFEHFTAEGVGWALRIALEIFREPNLWRKLVLNGMAQDFSWKRQSETYLAIYRRVLID